MSYKNEVVWAEDEPECDYCGAVANYDGKTNDGPWALMCTKCYKIHGVGVGLGRGQKLVRAKKVEEVE